MREVIFLNFGNTSNFISTHFWNLNDELFKVEDKFLVDNSVIYDDRLNPRNMIFDYSENIRPYFTSNDKLTSKARKNIEEEVRNNNRQYQIKTYEMDAGLVEDNKFLDLINEITIDEEEYNQFKNSHNKREDDYDQYNKSNSQMIQLKSHNELISTENQTNLPSNEIFKLSDEKIYDYLDLPNQIKNWNDFLQPKFHRRTFNEIVTGDVDLFSRNSYIKGHQFLHSENFAYSYLEPFEDNFRKFLEDCDKLELLNINVDFNSFWGGVSNSMIDQINDSIPKVMKIFNGVDSHSSFYSQFDDSFNVEKFINYLWYFTDLNSLKDSKSLFLPIFKHQNPSLIKETFGHNYNFKVDSHDPVYDFYFSSICGANLHSLYLPLRSKYFNKSSIFYNLLHTTSSSLNFFETDTLLDIDTCNLVQNMKTNGLPFNFSRNIRAKDFSWMKLYENSYKLNKFNSTVIHGFNEKNVFLDQKIESFLIKHSGINYTSVDRIDAPLCFPRKVLNSKGEGRFLKDLSLMCNYRPFVEFPLINFKFFPDYFKGFDLEVRKYLINHDNSKYIEYREKIEEFYQLVDSYDYINEAYGLNIKGLGDNSEDEEADY